MNQVAVERSPEIIAAEINAIKYQTQTMMLQASAEIGKRLVEAKEIVRHGEWGNWLKENVEYSQSTANKLMQIYQEYGPNSETFTNLSYSKAIVLLGLDSEERAAFVQENDVENLSTRELQKVVKEKQQLEKDLQQSTQTAEKEKSLLQEKIGALETALKQAQEENSDNDEKEVEMAKLTSELEAYRDKVNQLEQTLKKQPIEAVTVEVIPEHVQQELDTLRNKVYESTDPAEIKFKVHFEALVSEFNAVMGSLKEIENKDTSLKYSVAIVKLLDKMHGALKEVNKC